MLFSGMEDGSIALLESSSPSLRVYSTWKHSNKNIMDIKFSPNDQYLASASADTNIYVYRTDDKKSYSRLAVCRGHSGAVTHIDFSTTSKYIQSNGTDAALLFWETATGAQIKNSSNFRDVSWATFTCVFGWPVQGIWPPYSDYTDISCCMALPQLGDLVTGDDFNRVRPFHRLEYDSIDS
jgi:WD40 repeat protein